MDMTTLPSEFQPLLDYYVITGQNLNLTKLSPVEQEFINSVDEDRHFEIVKKD